MKNITIPDESPFKTETEELFKRARTCHVAGVWRCGRWFPTDPLHLAYCQENFRAPTRTFPTYFLDGCQTRKFNKHFEFITAKEANLVGRLSRLETRFESTKNDDLRLQLLAQIRKLESQI